MSLFLRPHDGDPDIPFTVDGTPNQVVAGLPNGMTMILNEQDEGIGYDEAWA